VAVDVPILKRRVRGGMERAGGEIQDVVDNKKQDEDPAPAHGARCKGGFEILAHRVGDRPSHEVAPTELIGGGHVQEERDEEDYPHNPEQLFATEERI